ncbi:membrane or secreted protein [Allomuricauda sp. F6463D]|uniref:membrane or secreted protein n=1 Tax=Allomuricauda sp. F6463D TaxID=2926409 RepID=UPI001FF4075F|nr:membrane or secreted protein [Muricauda sp. F6463D]MCK0161371.1 membrane or secreted protein [Muricauda sp. F6463D]
MKKIVILALYCLSFPILLSQNIQGAWESTQTNDEGVEIQYVTIFSGNFISEASFEKANGKFKGTWGGSFSIEDNVITNIFEYASLNPELVGTSRSTSYEVKNDKLHMGGKAWDRIDDGTPGDLFGAWLISGRKRDGEIVQRDTSGPRKTMKILSGTRFQWIAFNTETKAFMGTGGGTYTTIDGKYTENIGFFSRDDSRVGASLQFNYELVNGDWHHSGLSSKGKPIYEVWSIRTQ